MSKLKSFFHEDTSTLTYILHDNGQALIIDPVLDYDLHEKKTNTYAVEELILFMKENQLTPLYVLETHPHADHLTGAEALKKEFPDLKVAIGEGVKIVQETFKSAFELPNDFPTDGSQWDHLFKDGEEMQLGPFHLKAFSTPGHTPACMCYCIDHRLFTGDTMFMPDFGTGRCDFPNGDAKTLFKSITGLYKELPDDTRVFVGHDYQPGGRSIQYETSIAEQKAKNKHIQADTTEEEFVEFRTKRDAELSEPRLLKPSIHYNIGAGLI